MEIKKEVVGSFNLITTQDTEICFKVYDDNTMGCDKIEHENIKRLIIKPRFELYTFEYSKSGKTKFIAHYVSPFSYIKKYDIDDDMFDYLKCHGMISYSTEMAFVYGFKDKRGYDIEDQKRAFKRVKEDGVKRLKKQLLID